MELKASCMLSKEGVVLLVRKKGDSVWSLPGCFVSEEDVEAAALACLKDFCGVEGKIIQLFGIYEFQTDGKNYEHHVFEASSESDALNMKEGYEASWVDPKREKVDEELQSVIEEQ